MKFIPWEHLEDGELTQESKLSWFRSVCPGWRVVPDDIRIIPYGQDNEKIMCVMTVSVYDDKGKKMASYPFSGVYKEGDISEDNFGAEFVPVVFRLAIDEILNALGFTARNAEVMKRQSERQSEKRVEPDKEPEQASNKEPEPAEDEIYRKVEIMFQLVKKKGLLKNVETVEQCAERIFGISRITDENAPIIEKELKKLVEQDKGG